MRINLEFDTATDRPEQVARACMHMAGMFGAHAGTAPAPVLTDDAATAARLAAAAALAAAPKAGRKTKAEVAAEAAALAAALAAKPADAPAPPAETVAPVVAGAATATPDPAPVAETVADAGPDDLAAFTADPAAEVPAAPFDRKAALDKLRADIPGLGVQWVRHFIMEKHGVATLSSMSDEQIATVLADVAAGATIQGAA